MEEANDVPQPVDLTVLRRRAQAYILGLEAQLKRALAEVDRLQTRLEEAELVEDLPKIKMQVYTQGWKDALEYFHEPLSEMVERLGASYVQRRPNIFPPNPPDFT